MSAEAIGVPSAQSSPSATGDVHPLLLGCLIPCQTCLDLARGLTLEQYTTPPQGYQSIGSHLRHCLDHLTAFVRGIDAGAIDYDDRERDPEIESNPNAFIQAMTKVIDRLARVGGGDLDRILSVSTMPAPGCSAVTVRSTLARELGFLASHTIHHLAIVKMLARALGVPVPAEVGVAYSTAAYWAGAAAQPEAHACAR